MRYKGVILCLLVAFMLLSIGCQSNERKSDLGWTHDYDLKILPDTLPIFSEEIEEIKKPITLDKSKINENLTLGEALNMFGSPKPYTNTTGSRFVFVYSWDIDDNTVLTISFDSEDREEFLKAYQNGDYVLPDETLVYKDEGIRYVTENEIKVLVDFIKGQKAIGASITRNGQREVLFKPIK